MSNKEIASVLKQSGKLLELYGENDFKVKSYNNAAFRIERLEEALVDLNDDEILKIPGIGKSMGAKVRMIIEIGTIEEYEEKLKNTPPGVLEIMSIKGIGAKKTGVIWRELGVQSMGELLYACNENRLTTLKGFGEKLQNKIKKAIEYSMANANKFHYASADEVAQTLKSLYASEVENNTFLFSGAYRRCCIVLDSLDIVTSIDVDKLTKRLDPKLFIQVEPLADKLFSYKHVDGLLVNFHLHQNDQLLMEHFLLTGGSEHLNQINELDDLEKVFSKCADEDEIYSNLGLHFIPPELREGKGEISFALKQPIPQLIELTDLKGALHNHSQYSDGVNSLRDMAVYCKEIGYEYLGICDHSKSAFYANGLQPQRVLEQHKEIDELNAELAPFKIFKGIESDILYDGSLDYEPEILETFDFIVASVHSGLNMDIDKATERIITAVSNPFTTILGHPTGRLLLAREGYPLDHKKVIDACRDHNVVIELNAHPYRLDLDWRWIHYAMNQGVLISINPDAHSTSGLHDMYFGICAGRKGWLTAKATLNALSCDEIDVFFKNRKASIPAV